jgi:two-component system, NtrC family, sensor kinase
VVGYYPLAELEGTVRRHGTASRKTVKTRRRKATEPKPSSTVIPARRSHSSVVDPQEKLKRQAGELEEAREERAALAEVLRVISRSAFDLQAVLDTLVESATRLCEAQDGFIVLPDGDVLRPAARFGFTPEYHKFLEANPITVDRGSVTGRTAIEGRVVHVADVPADPDYARRDVQQIGGYRTALGVPLLREGKVIGVIFLSRTRPQPFTDKQIELVTTFADQAVIAIENARLLNELRQSLEQQTATSEVLKIISRSPAELEPVFQAILANATRLCGAKFGSLSLYDGEAFRYAAAYNVPAEYEEARLRQLRWQPHPLSGSAKMARTNQPVQINDLRTSPAYLEGDWNIRAIVDLGGARTLLLVPMLKDDALVGLIAIYRKEVQPFTEKQIALVQNFAAQAVIAIENARLLNDLRQRTNDLSESLERQTATSEVLRVISSSRGDLQPVFDAILANATNLCDAGFASLRLSEGDQFRTVSLYNAPAALVEHWRSTPLVRPHPESALGRAALTKQVIQIDDVRKGPAYSKGDPLSVAGADLGGYRTVLSVPMLREDVLVGVIAIYRQEVRPFTEKQIELVKSFASQAVIAIENTRLLNELRESLTQQTATADVLKVISTSPGALEPVFQAMLENATRICEATFGMFWFAAGDGFRPVALHGVPPGLPTTGIASKSFGLIRTPQLAASLNRGGSFTSQTSGLNPDTRRAFGRWSNSPTSAEPARFLWCHCSRGIRWSERLPFTAKRFDHSPTSRSHYSRISPPRP